MRIFLTADLHGNRKFLVEFAEKFQTTPDDLLIIAGDVGLNFYLTQNEENRNKRLADLPLTVLCIRGNHEERPRNIQNYSLNTFFNGAVWENPDYPNIKFADEGAFFNFFGFKVMTIGGAYSIDKEYREARDWPWFPEEQLTKEEMEDIKLTIANRKFDLVVTHTCPFHLLPRHLFLNFDIKEDHTMEHFLEEIYWLLGENFNKWYCGHFHYSTILNERVCVVGAQEVVLIKYTGE